MTLVRNETQRHSAALKIAGQNPIGLLPLDGFSFTGSSELSVGDRVLVGVVVLGGERTCPSAVVESLGLGLCACC